MRTFPNRRYVFTSVLIHLAALLLSGHVVTVSSHKVEPQEAVAVRFIDFSPAENVPEETPDTAKVWSSKATKAHGGAGEKIAKRSSSTVTASTPPKGEPFSFQRKESPPLETAMLSPDTPPSPGWQSLQEGVIAVSERPIRLDLEPVLPDQTETSGGLLRNPRDVPIVDDAPKRELTPTSPSSAAVTEGAMPRVTDVNLEKVQPETNPAKREKLLDEGEKNIKVAASDLAGPDPEKAAPSALIEPGELSKASISRETERTAKEPLQPRLSESNEIAISPPKESSKRPLPLEEALAQDIAPKEQLTVKHEEVEPAAVPDEVSSSAKPDEQSENLEQSGVAEEREGTEAARLADRTSPTAKLRTRLRLGGKAPGQPNAPKAGEKTLGPEELFPTDIIQRFGAMESNDVDLTDVSDAVSLDTNELRYFSYFAKIKKEIEEQWRYPPKAAILGQHGSLSLLFVLDQTGKVTDIRFSKTSGYQLLDSAAMDAILEADPFPPFPEHLKRERSTLRINARFTYELYGTI